MLLRATPISTSRSATEELSGVPHSDTHSQALPSKLVSNGSSFHQSDIGIASNPIVLDDDVGDCACVEHSVRGVGLPPSPDPQGRTPAISHDADTRTDFQARSSHSMRNRGCNERRLVPSAQCSESMTYVRYCRWPNDSSPHLGDTSLRPDRELPTSGDIDQAPKVSLMKRKDAPSPRT